MNEVHKSHNLHNDLSSDNILFHFPDDESKVYIGVCDWGLASKDSEQGQSPYTFTNAEQMSETLRRRWWVEFHSCIPAQTKCRCAYYSPLNKGFRGVCHSPYSATNQRPTPCLRITRCSNERTETMPRPRTQIL